MENLNGKINKTSNGYNSYEIIDADASFILKIATVVTEKFEFTRTNPIIGLEQVFMDFDKDGIKITTGWDIWSGCFVMTHDKLGDKCIEEIGNYLEKTYINDWNSQLG
ncbi:hypothetical protein [Paenibacillus sp. SI8]|uniref:hypothetical protein n=1 Tax=unclassified Paenibacillus TaxID=185978 RepID=UPI003465D8F5